MAESLWDNGKGIRLIAHSKGTLEIEFYEPIKRRRATLTKEEVKDVVTSLLPVIMPELDDKVFCADCAGSWPDDRCKHLVERPDRIPTPGEEPPELEPAICTKINPAGHCGYYDPRKVDDEDQSQKD